MTLDVAMDSLFLVNGEEDEGGMLPPQYQFVVEPLIITPVTQKKNGYSFGGVNVTAEILQVRQGKYEVGQEITWEFDPFRANSKAPWEAIPMHKEYWVVLSPSEVRWCPICEERLNATPDYLCGVCRWGS